MTPFSTWTNENRLRTLFYDYTNDSGIFDAPAFSSMPWASVVTSADLNESYFGAFSGFKRPSPYVIAKAVQSDEINDGLPYIPQSARYKIAKTIAIRFASKWNALWDAYTSHYSIMDESSYTLTTDTSATKTEDTTSVLTKAGSESSAESGSTGLTHGHTITTTPAGTETRRKDYSGTESFTKSGTESKTEADTGAGNVFGFNSSTAVPDTTTSANSTSSLSFTGRTDTTGFDNRYDTETLSFSSRSDTQSNSGTDTTTHGKTTTTSFTNRSDTTDVDGSVETTSLVNQTKTGHEHSRAALIAEFLDVFQNDYFRIVFRDIDSVLALGQY